MQPTDLLAMKLEEALYYLDSAGFNYQIQYTDTPFAVNKGAQRLVRVKFIDERTLLLTVASEVCGGRGKA